jgi:hypothetical protein
MAWGGRLWPGAGGNGLLRTAISCGVQRFHAEGVVLRAAMSCGVRRRTSPCGLQRRAASACGRRQDGVVLRRSAWASTGGGRRGLPGASCGRGVAVLCAGGGVLWLMAKALCEGVIWGKVFFLSDSDQRSGVSSMLSVRSVLALITVLIWVIRWKSDS